jgi:hypothetical protein
MSAISKIAKSTEEETLTSAILCAPCKVASSSPVTGGPANKRQKLQPSKKNQKFTAENLSFKRKESQKILTKLAFKPCCTKQCLLRQFGNNDDPEYFDFYEAKKCVDYFYDIYKFKSKEEYHNWLYDKFISTCYGLDEAGKIIHQYRLSYGTVQDPKTFLVCKEVWAYFLNTTEYRLKILSEAYKKGISAIGLNVNMHNIYSDKTNHHATVEEMKQIYEELGLEYNLESAQMGAIQPHETETFFWFRDHFNLVGDSMPNTDGEVHIDKVEKQDIYCMYVNEVRNDCLSFSAWSKFWKRVFPNVLIRQWKNVSGKCEDCAKVNNGRLVAQSLEEAKAFRKLHLVHKSMLYMPERLSYHARRNEAKNDGTILSVIIDTMDNNHCSVPYVGSGDTFNNPIHQGILGCFAHNSGKFTIYRTVGI